jgi:patatin-like phospholipase/acyl hydrolase
MSVSEAKSSIPGGEFIRWQEYFLRLYDRPKLTDWQLARIAYEIAFLRHSVHHLFNPKPPKFELTPKDFIMKFTVGDQQEKKLTEEEEEQQRQEHIERSKAAWLAIIKQAPKARVDKDGNLLPVNNGPNQNRGKHSRGR